MAVGIDSDWLVADSEDEDAFPPVNGFGAPEVTGNLTLSDSSVIQTAVISTYQPRTPRRGRQSPSTLVDRSLFTPPNEDGMDTTIGVFTNATSAYSELSKAPPKPRPRPRVVMKKAATSDHNTDAAHTSFSHISDPPISRQITESIHPATATSVRPSETVDDAYSSFSIAERAKLRSRKSQTAKKPVHAPYQTNEVIELTSDEDELVLKSMKRQKRQDNPVPKSKVQTKPRPKPTLKVKPAVALPSGSPSSQTMNQDSESSLGRHASQLPVSTLPTVPPSTPPQPRELTPLSSPPVPIRKRKRTRPSIAEDDDEMDIIGSNTSGVPVSPKQPPSFFAVSSSSVPTDSGVEIFPVESLSDRGRKKQASSSKRGTRTRLQNKGRKGKKVEMTSAVDEVVEEPTRITQEPPTLAAEHTSSFAKDCHSPLVRISTAAKKVPGKQTGAKNGKARAIDSCEEEDELLPSKSNTARTLPASEREGEGSKENLGPDDTSPPQRNPQREDISTSGLRVRGSLVRPKLTPMSELIRRVNSQPSSPFPNATRTYSPLLKSSRTMLSRIAPLHTNRRTPPPPMPRPPPPKKTKKQLEMEERIEEELAETIDGWVCLTDEERKALRKARIDAILGYE